MAVMFSSEVTASPYTPPPAFYDRCWNMYEPPQMVPAICKFVLEIHFQFHRKISLQISPFLILVLVTGQRMRF